MEIQCFSSLKLEYESKSRFLIKQIQDFTNLENQELASILKISVSRLENFYNYKESIKLDSLLGLMNKFNISLDALKSGEIDIKTLQEHYTGNLNYIPDKYSTAQFSKGRTILNSFNFLKDNFGFYKSDMTQRYFQLNRTILSAPDKNINIHFVEDVYNYLSTLQGLSLSDFYNMGRYNLKTLQGSTFYETVSKFKTTKQIYENLINHQMFFFEKNSDYKIKLINSQECIISSNANEEVSDLLKIKKVGNPETCKYREGFFSILPNIINQPSSIVNELTCVHKGDSECTFHIKYPNLINTQKSKPHLYIQ